MSNYLGADESSDIEKRAEEVFRKNRWKQGLWSGVHMKWDDFARLSAKLFSGLLARPIEAEIIRREKSCWSISFWDSVNELHALLTFWEADEGELENSSL